MKKKNSLLTLPLVACLLSALPIATLGIGSLNGKNVATMFIREAKQPQGFPVPAPVGQILVKDYPIYRLATVSNEGRQQNSMFRTLFKHIKKNDIAMTAPVEMTFDEAGPKTMVFLYASTDIGALGEDDDVKIVDLAAAKVVAIGVRGNYTRARFEKNREKLNEWLVENSDQWVEAGNPRYHAFNSPFVPGFMKYGEVQIPIRKTTDN